MGGRLRGVDNFRKQFSDKEIRDIGEVINTFTGSGGKRVVCWPTHENIV